jgi:hypothetical protein
MRCGCFKRGKTNQAIDYATVMAGWWCIPMREKAAESQCDAAKTRDQFLLKPLDGHRPATMVAQS